MSRMHNPAHPGAVLKEWLAEVSISQVVRRGAVAGSPRYAAEGVAEAIAKSDFQLRNKINKLTPNPLEFGGIKPGGNPLN